MPPRRRPTAFEVSFPELAAEETQGDSVDTDASNRKRARDTANDHNARGRKRRNMDEARPRSARQYSPKPAEILENPDFIVVGEDPEDGDDDSKPVRILRDFSFFDPTESMEMLSLALLEDDPGARHHLIEGAGAVFPTFEDEEDEGQEEDLDDDDELQYIRLPTLLRYSIDYTKEDDPVFVETDNAFYELQGPSRRYRRYFREFYKPLKIMQEVVFCGLNTPNKEYKDFLKNFLKVTVVDHPLTEGDLWSIVPRLNTVLEELANSEGLRNSTVIRHLLLREPPPLPKGRIKAVPRRPADSGKGKVEQTRVTPRIAKLAAGLFREEFGIVGPPPKPEAPSPQQDLLIRRLRTFVEKSAKRNRKIQFRPEQRLRPRSRWLKSIIIDAITYSLGDVILVSIGQNEGRAAPNIPDPRDIPPNATLADYFWFGKIVSINEEHETIHAQWFEHSSKTAMQEINDPQELFLTDICSTIDFTLVVDRVMVHFFDPSQEKMPRMTPLDFFYKFVYDNTTATFMEVTPERLQSGTGEHPPNNCPACLLVEERNEQLHGQSIPNGVAWNGINYHVNDSVLIKAEEGPCHIGHIVDVIIPRSHHESDEIQVRVKLFGRIDKLGIRPPRVLKDERHLFVTNDQMTFSVSELIGVCYVYVSASIPEADLKTWLSISPRHFFAKYSFPSLNVRTWDERQRLEPSDLLVCKSCVSGNVKQLNLTKEFLSKNKPLRAFDPFGGVGAFGLALELSGCVKVTHTVEICPSAAESLRKNASRDTKVYNQCANVMLRHAIKAHAGHDVEELRSIEGDRLPAPPKPGDIDCILAGFPCQSHSQLNMYRKANDPKSSLILNVLSWIDFMQPKICIFENVRGFLAFRLKARQAGEFKIEGGIEMGGLKFVLRALLDMNYQVRFALLQAAHYGTPQTRVRFFLIAAKPGHPLPEFPQPSHDFPLVDALQIKLPNGHHIRPIRTMNGTAPHRFVSIDDAISDLLRYDWQADPWKNPRPPRDAKGRREEERRRQTVPTRNCDAEKNLCGFRGPDVEYEHEPRTSFQKWCREKNSSDLQHYTRTYDAKKVERVVSIPLEANADYRRLRPDLWEWHFANPTSAIAKASFRPGLYGRMDKDGWFQTTVTNVDPSAKQCRVLNPYCKRVVTVRELARSQGFPDHFVFYSKDNKIKRMHRQIGNAVPWQLSIALGRELRSALIAKWVKDQEDAMEVE
ncbi:S-adenosyl-L-methionine-dependent methyltransferase [Leucogyrophana mollusca]|uniref:S-adenosyl-L-methionine-dependent methyltransferase n=1 Tax=Leucogyrophana mollusca TaxID=85980 RepID=A0ACB8BMZ6_9AGAM|nr:S-adenosyl-L-methionine-dependent methyltransferase [Leucogyrophana mollusca]